MLRFFSQFARKPSLKSITLETTQEQLKRLSQDPKYAEIIEKMQVVSQHVQKQGGGKPISAEDIDKLLELERESAKFSIY